MARIAFCWELGRGLGHVVPHLDLIRRLVARGDEVVFLAQDPARVASVFQHRNFSVRPLAHGFTPLANRMRDADSYPQVLFNSGFHEPRVLHARLVDVIATLESTAPDAIVCDYAPSVMLANRVVRRPLVLTGNGFWVPPRATPMPRFRYWQGPVPTGYAAREAKVLEVINSAIGQFGVSPFATFADFFAVDRQWLCIHAELDFYSERPAARYMGTFPDHEFGAPPRWPHDNGPKVFAYLTPGPTVAATLAALVAQHASVCLYAPGFTATEERELQPEIFYRAMQPVSLPAVAAGCQAFVNNANLSTASAALLTGKPQLCLPGTAEQYMHARRIELLGAGLAAPRRRPGDIAAKLHALLNETAYTRAAARFARKYAGACLSDRTDCMLAELDELL